MVSGIERVAMVNQKKEANCPSKERGQPMGNQRKKKADGLWKREGGNCCSKKKNLMISGIERVTMADQKRKKIMVFSKNARG